MTINIDQNVARATKDALLDHFHDVKSAHLSEALACLFGFRTSVALKTALATEQPIKGEFCREAAGERLRLLRGCDAASAAAFIEIACTAAINANIEANRANQVKRRAERAEAMPKHAKKESRYAELDGKLIGFVVKTRHAKFKPFIGRIMEIPEDRDALIHVIGEKEPQDTLESALEFYQADRNQFALVLEQPVAAGGMMGHWLNDMLSRQDNQERTTSEPRF